MNPLRVALAKVRWSLHHRGVFGTLKTATGRLAPRKNGAHAQVIHPFDTRYGVETSGLLTAVALASGQPNDLLGTGYSGTPPSRFGAVMEKWVAAPPERPIESYTFIDIGSGKGRAMMLATAYPFAEIIGVEMNHSLTQIAATNLEKWHAANPTAPPTRVVCQDALTFEFPTTPCLIYLYNPFAEPVLRQLIERVEQSFAANPRPVDVLYCNPVSARLFENHSSYRQLWSGRVPVSPEDAAAESFASSDEPCFLFSYVAP
jgi:hypothetical protein